MTYLHIGSSGDEVREIQVFVRRYEPALAVNGIFDGKTERAVRLAQRRLGICPPNGIVDPITFQALEKANGIVPKPGRPTYPRPGPSPGGMVVRSALDVGRLLGHEVAQAMRRAVTGPMPSDEARPVAGMSLSEEGSRFIISHESQRNVSNHLHHPSAGSGVTIGPGYDMKDRSRAEVQRELESIRVPTENAAQAALGAGLVGSQASRFARDNRDVLDLRLEQESLLLAHIAGSYEAKVKRPIKIRLHQYEFDALVSYAYNPGGGWLKTTAFVNGRKNLEAMQEIKRHVFSKGQLIGSLVRRRTAESKMFLYGEYQ